MDFSKFEDQLGDWGPKLKPFIESKECDELYTFLKEEKRRGRKICPYWENTFRAFKETPYKDLKVVFILQDPYNRISSQGIMISDGVAMSCKNTGKLQPSLEKFYEAVEDDVFKGMNLNMIRNPDLTFLCNQGIMMTNTALTVEKDKPTSHGEAWKPFMKYMFEEVYSKYNNGLIFVLAGKQSQYFARYINPLQHYIIEVEHPAFAARKERKWRHDGLFSKINKILKENNNYEPIWDYEESPF